MGLSELMRPDVVALTLFLIGTGAVLKYRTPVDNNLIAVVLFVLAFILSTIISYTEQADLLRALVAGGIIKGGGSAAVAVFGWDSIHGLAKAGHRVRGQKNDEL